MMLLFATIPLFSDYPGSRRQATALLAGAPRADRGGWVINPVDARTSPQRTANRGRTVLCVNGLVRDQFWAPLQDPTLTRNVLNREADPRLPRD